MNGSLPPELGDMPFGAQMYQDLMAEQDAQKSSFGERLAADPFFQMGAAILGAPGYGGNFMRAVGQGMSQGLQNAQAAEAGRRQAIQQQIHDRLYERQINNETFRLLGGEQPTVYEQGQMEYQRGQVAGKMRELDLRERGLYEGGGGSSDMEPWGIVGPDGSVRYESVPKGQVPRTSPDERLFNPRVGKQTPSGGSGGSSGSPVDVNKLDQAISMIDSLRNLAVDPETGAFRSADVPLVPRGVKRLWDGLMNAKNQLQQNPENARGMSAELYDRQLSSIAGTLAKAYGDTGTLSEGDIKRALASMPKAGWLLPDSREFAETAIAHLRSVLEAKRAAASSGSLPPETGGLPPSGIPSGWSVEVE
jgi:hypothetical protein